MATVEELSKQRMFREAGSAFYVGVHRMFHDEESRANFVGGTSTSMRTLRRVDAFSPSLTAAVPACADVKGQVWEIPRMYADWMPRLQKYRHYKASVKESPSSRSLKALKKERKRAGKDKVSLSCHIP